MDPDHNHDPVNSVPLAGWAVRDSHLRGDKHKPGYKFPSSAVIPPAGSIVVNVGEGTDDATTFHWGFPEKETIFENASNDKKQAGDGAYLFDPDGELRAYAQYPCRMACAEPLAGKITVTARYLGLEHEWVTITNTSAEPVNLYQYELENSPWFYEFGPRDVIEPGEAIVVWVNRPHEVPVTNGSRVLTSAVPGSLPLPGRPAGRVPELEPHGRAAQRRRGRRAPAQPARHAGPGRVSRLGRRAVPERLEWLATLGVPLGSQSSLPS